MLKNYLVTILRQIAKNKVFSFINISGLALGMAACLVISQYVYFHTSFDSHIPDADRIFRVQSEGFRQGESQGQLVTIPSPIGEELIEQSPNTEELVRFYPYNYANNTIIYTSGDDKLNSAQEGIYATEKSAFEFFDLKFVAGSAEKFDEPKKAILTLSGSRKFFKDPSKEIGKTFTMSGNNGAVEYELVGVIQDLPKNTHMDFELLISYPSIDEFTGARTRWTYSSVHTYVKVPDASKAPIVLNDINRIFDENARELMEERGAELKFEMRPLTDIHLTTTSPSDFTAGLDSKIVISLSIIALVILVIAWINYMNLSLVRTVERLKEMGIRKCLGSSTRQIVKLFLMEALVMNVLAIGVAILGIQLLESYLIELTGLPVAALMSLDAMLILAGLVALGTLIVGMYPYLILKTMNIVNVLVGKARQMTGSRMRKALVFVQFAVTFLLIAGTLTVYNQINYMRDADLGIDIENVLVIKSPPGDVSAEERQDVARFATLKTELLKQSGITEITNSGDVPGQPIGWGVALHLKNQPQETAINTSLISMDYDFPKFFGIGLVAGRNIQQGDDPWTRGDIVINEKMAEMLGFATAEDAIGAELDGFYGPTLKVRGVLENHHHTSLHNDYTPIAYILSSWTEFYFVKLRLDGTQDGRRDQLAGLVRTVENEWSQVFTDYQMEYFFLDSSFDEQYKEDLRFGKIFSGFSGLTILIACLGLFGLTSFTIQQRTKEIGIRKTLGASFNNLIMLLSREYLVLVGAACLISIPFSWWLMVKWLEGYTFRIDLGWWFFVVPVLFVLFLAMASIISKILGTVRTNPVESLRYE